MSAAISGGVIWSFLDYDKIRADVPDGDAVLQWLVYDNIDSALTWLESAGAALSPTQAGGAVDNTSLTKLF